MRFVDTPAQKIVHSETPVFAQKFDLRGEFRVGVVGNSIVVDRFGLEKSDARIFFL